MHFTIELLFFHAIKIKYFQSSKVVEHSTTVLNSLTNINRSQERRKKKKRLNGFFSFYLAARKNLWKRSDDLIVTIMPKMFSLNYLTLHKH